MLQDGETMLLVVLLLPVLWTKTHSVKGFDYARRGLVRCLLNKQKHQSVTTGPVKFKVTH
jgi:hypothetical protein